MVRFSLLLILAFLTGCSSTSSKAKIILIAGSDSHPHGAHEFLAGCNLLKNKLDESMGDKVETILVKKDWPEDISVFNGAAAVVVYSDGRHKHPLKDKQDIITKLADKGVGIGMMHYACDVHAGEQGDNFKKWIGGYYEAGWSTNPHWVCDSILHKTHPISKSVKNFSVNDEWYFNMRWADTPFHTDILQGIPNKETRTTGRSKKLTHLHKALGKKETLLWAVERKDGGRGFGFTGGHNHSNWKHDEFRKLVLNAIVWLAKVDVPENGVESKTPTDAEMHHLTKLDRGTGPKVKKK